LDQKLTHESKIKDMQNAFNKQREQDVQEVISQFKHVKGINNVDLILKNYLHHIEHNLRSEIDSYKEHIKQTNMLELKESLSKE